MAAGAHRQLPWPGRENGLDPDPTLTSSPSSCPDLPPLPVPPASHLISAGFYSAGTYASLQSPAVEELFAAYVPGGERLIDWAEDKGLDKVGAGEVAGCVVVVVSLLADPAASAVR